MNRLMANMIATMLVIPFAAVADQNAGAERAEAPSVSTSEEVTSATKASTDQPSLKPGSDDAKAQAQGTAAQSPATKAGTDGTSKDDKPAEPITGAFGIPLSELFNPSMVAKVLAEQEQSYRGPDGAELKGSLLRVEPSQQDERFQRYTVRTTDKGVVYAIEGDYQMEVEQAKGKQADRVKRARLVRSTCKDVVKTLAGELEASYGKPRGKGWGGEWFSFRQISGTDNKSIRLYAHRCRSGMYSVIYTDEQLLRGVPDTAAEPPGAGAPAAASLPAEP